MVILSIKTPTFRRFFLKSPSIDFFLLIYIVYSGGVKKNEKISFKIEDFIDKTIGFIPLSGSSTYIIPSDRDNICSFEPLEKGALTQVFIPAFFTESRSDEEGFSIPICMWSCKHANALRADGNSYLAGTDCESEWKKIHWYEPMGDPQSSQFDLLPQGSEL